ncbi:MAG: YihY/virulence factor BrkB family protein [Crocinitomicaceae bacterium]|nr:YihY/virulence factor BrkB family protein [Crocinitomicaceae bacterium]MDP4724542.1 YihY/virulence factor BrkB family protein [Crocinitomicaceae bacterium]MDP4739101.1 YihY/virulence factor BrkB family protein [Crocinitomicaceae bacterium]MDP4799782.1 YihY/virulence factor BrkB family protein [Crocinitomicaceae bacterium]MDP4806142.1 YihY/virulence factor BrkB family protein [Crocinitomicaceae bacterium]
MKSAKNKHGKLRLALQAFWTALKGYVQDGAFHHGAALAYYTLFAFIPIIYLTTSIYGRIIGQQNMRDIITTLLKSELGLQDPASILQLVDSMSFDKPNFFLELVSIGVLLYTCSAFMISLKRSLNEFFHVSKKSRQESNLFMEIIGFRFVGVLLLAVFALVIILFYFLQIFIFSALTGWLQWNNGFVDFSLQLLQIFLTLLSNVLIFTLIFKYMHNAKVSWRIARDGAIVTAILLYLSQWVIGYYLQHYFIMGKLGVANSIFIMLAWVHYSAQIVFFGAQFTYQIGKVFQDRILSDIKETTAVS